MSTFNLIPNFAKTIIYMVVFINDLVAWFRWNHVELNMILYNTQILIYTFNRPGHQNTRTTSGFTPATLHQCSPFNAI